jgi:hypothetical protein
LKLANGHGVVVVVAHGIEVTAETEAMQRPRLSGTLPPSGAGYLNARLLEALSANP